MMSEFINVLSWIFTGSERKLLEIRENREEYWTSAHLVEHKNVCLSIHQPNFVENKPIRFIMRSVPDVKFQVLQFQR